jgi:hypothetical protein
MMMQFLQDLLENTDAPLYMPLFWVFGCISPCGWREHNIIGSHETLRIRTEYL